MQKASAEILLHALNYSFCTNHSILAHFLTNAVVFKGIKNYLCTSCSALVPKMLVNTSGGQVSDTYMFFNGIKN